MSYKSYPYTFNTTKNGVDGANGEDGRGVEEVKAQYYLSTSKATQTGGSWSYTAPTWSSGKYLWIREEISYTDGDVIYTTPYCDNSWEAVNDVDAQILAWCYENNKSYINGNKIYANTITADKLKVNSLSSLSANLGDITGGSLNINNKFIVDSNGNATVDGKITARSGNIAGFTLDENKMYSSVTKKFDFTSADYTRAQQIVMGDVTPTSSDYARLDVTGDGIIGANDYAIIKNLVDNGNSVETKFVINPTYSTANNNEGVFEVSVQGYHTTKITNVGALYSSRASLDDLSVKKISFNDVGTGYIGYNGGYSLRIVNEASGYMTFDTGGTQFSFTNSHGSFYISNCIRPSSSNDNKYSLGASNSRWSTVYAGTGSINTSDRTKKKDFRGFDERYEQLFMDLKPTLYRFIDGTSNRIHSGFISQDVEESMLKCGLTALDFAGFCKDKKQVVKEVTKDGVEVFEDALDENGNQIYDYSLRYQEFIALNTHMIQKLQDEVKALKEEINKLKGK